MQESRSKPIWCIIPWVTDWPSTEQAIDDVLHQSVPTRVLLVSNGVTPEERREAETVLRDHGNVLCWWADPALPSLAKTWNEGLKFVWATGGDRAWVLNNDLRVRPSTLAVLSEVMDTHQDKPFFVSAVNDPQRYEMQDLAVVPGSRGGPDFSCFLISREMHIEYPFCEEHKPAYTEDLCTHRRVMLNGEGHRMFSIPYPYSHTGSGTLKALDPDRRKQLEWEIEHISRAAYAKEWGGPANQERFIIPYGPEEHEGVTTPELFESVRSKW